MAQTHDLQNTTDVVYQNYFQERQLSYIDIDYTFKVQNQSLTFFSYI